MSSVILDESWSSQTTRTAGFGVEFSRWTNQVLKSLTEPMDKASTTAYAKIMSMMTSELYLDEGIQSVSARFAEGFLSEEERLTLRNGTAQSIHTVTSPEFAEITKDLLISQLVAHELAPKAYMMDDNSTAIEFLDSISRLVCVFDDDGLQLLWRADGKTLTEFVEKDALDLRQIEQRVALILHMRELVH